MSPLPTPRVASALRQRLIWPVWNRDQRRLRAPFRAFLPLVTTFLALALLQSTVRSFLDHPWVELTELAGFTVILAVGIVASARLIDRRPITEYGLSVDRGWWRSFAVGGLIATVVNAGTLALLSFAGWVTVVGVTETPGVIPFPLAMVVTFALIAVAAAWEEFVFRAAMLKNLAEGADGYLPRRAAIGVAVLLGSVVFALLHAGKVDHLGEYGYYLLAGLILSGAYVLTGDLSLPVGFHVCYNYTMSAVFGLGVSQRTPELLVLDVVGPPRWIGEEGLARVGFAALGGGLLVAYVYWRDGHLHLHDRVTRWAPSAKP